MSINLYKLKNFYTLIIHVLSKMGVTLYHFPPSAFSRTALLVAKALEIDVDVQIIDLFKKEQLKPEFIKINPQHIVPTLVDGDFVLSESAAIAAYLVRKYGKNDHLYPKDLKLRAIVNQRMQFNIGTLYPRLRAITFPVMYLDEIEVSDDKKATLDEALGFLDIFLDGQDFLAGDKLTIADISSAASVSSMIAIGWNVSPYSNVSAWIARCALQIPHFEEINQTGANAFAKAFKSKVAPGQI